MFFEANSAAQRAQKNIIVSFGFTIGKDNFSSNNSNIHETLNAKR